MWASLYLSRRYSSSSSYTSDILVFHLVCRIIHSTDFHTANNPFAKILKWLFLYIIDESSLYSSTSLHREHLLHSQTRIFKNFHPRMQQPPSEFPKIQQTKAQQPQTKKKSITQKASIHKRPRPNSPRTMLRSAKKQRAKLLLATVHATGSAQVQKGAAAAARINLLQPDEGI